MTEISPGGTLSNVNFEARRAGVIVAQMLVDFPYVTAKADQLTVALVSCLVFCGKEPAMALIASHVRIAMIPPAFFIKRGAALA